MSHGSEPFARYASESRKTGVRYLIAIRAASIAASKQPAGVDARDDRDRRLRVAPEHDHEQVGLLGLRRHSCRRAGALDVDDDERQLERDREPDGLRLEHDARARRGRDAERAAERGAESRAGRRDLVLGLERPHAELLQLRELLEDVRGGRDRVGAEEERKPGELARRDEAVASAVFPEIWRYVPGASCAGATSYETAKSSDVSP